MFRRFIAFIVVSLTICTVILAGEPETEISYTTSDLGAGRWQYEYQVSNLSLTEGIEEFTIWFDYGLYDNLTLETLDPPASSWNELRWQPDPVLGDDGGYDALALGLPIGIGESISGFSVSFDWLGMDEPGNQFYEIIDPDTFATIDSGFTIPEPSCVLLMAFGTGLALRSRKLSTIHDSI